MTGFLTDNAIVEMK